MARQDNRDLDAEARRAGFPGGRKEREAFRRATRAAAKKGAAAPRPPTPKAKYKPLPPGTPGGRGRRADATRPSTRAKGRWHGLGSGGRVQVTGGQKTALNALRSASRRGETVWITAKGNVIKNYEGRPSDAGEATLRGWSANTVLAAIQAAGGDVRAGLSELLEGLQEYASVTDITEVTIRAYR